MVGSPNYASKSLRDEMKSSLQLIRCSIITPLQIIMRGMVFPRFSTWSFRPVCSSFPSLHIARFLRKRTYEYEERGGREWNFEMRPLSYELLKADLVHWIDHRFNAVWKNIKCLHYPFLTFRHKSSFVLRVQKRLSRELGFHYRKRLARHCATAAFQNNYFLHFAGAFHEIGLVEQPSRCRGA